MSGSKIIGLAFAGLATLAATGAAIQNSALGQTPQEQRRAEAPLLATATPSPQLSWITLGTQGGPIPDGERSQPANLLVVDAAPHSARGRQNGCERRSTAPYIHAPVHHWHD